MDLEPQSKSQKYSEPTADYRIQCLQEGLFFGLEYIKSQLPFAGYSYFLDGDYIFEGQTLLSLYEGKNRDSIVSLLSYLSGAYTLASCFSEIPFPFSVCAYGTPHFAYNEGEKQALLKAGMSFKKLPEEKFLSPQEFKAKRSHFDRAYLRVSRSNKEEVKRILRDSQQEFELMGNLFPKEWEDFTDCNNIQAVYPLCLQGFFPALNLKAFPEAE